MLLQILHLVLIGKEVKSLLDYIRNLPNSNPSTSSGQVLQRECVRALFTRELAEVVDQLPGLLIGQAGEGEHGGLG